jgi:hypothetical protein
MCNYYSKVFPGSNCIVTSKDQDGISILFREKIYIPYQHLDASIRPDELSRNDTKQKCFLKLGVSHLGIDNSEKYSISTIELRETSEKPSSPQNFSGQGAAFGFWDEFPLHPRKDALLNSGIECFRNPFTKELDGFLLFGGTFESSMSNEEVEGFRQIVENKALWNCEILFIPFWWSMFLNPAGYPDEKRAYQWWEDEYEKLKASPAKLKAFIRNNPRSLEDIFETTSGGRWEDETLEVILAQKKKILEADVPCHKHSMINLGGKITSEPNQKGKYHMLEPVKPGCKYAICIDGTGTGTETGSISGSEMASVVVKVMDPQGDPYMPVNIYSERPKTVEAGYEKILNQILYYNAYGGIETIAPEAGMGTIDSFSTFLTKEGLHKLIMRRKDLSGKGWTNTNKLGQFRTLEIIDFQYKSANIFLRKYAPSIQMMPLIIQMLLPKNANADILDAWLMFFCAYPNFQEAKKEKVFTPPKRTMLTMSYENGRTVLKEIPI